MSTLRSYFSRYPTLYTRDFHILYNFFSTLWNGKPELNNLLKTVGHDNSRQIGGRVTQID